MRPLLLLGLGLVLVTACSDDNGGTVKNDGPSSAIDGGMEAAVPDATASDMLPSALSRLERPTDLPRPPIDRLPADLLPPGP